MGSNKKTSSMLKAACRVFAIILISLLLLSGMPAATAFAQTTGTADGTYDFGGLGDNGSGGTGYRALGDKFKMPNGDYLIAGAGYTAFAPNSTDHDYHQFIYAEGGSVCKTFTFQDMGLSAFADGVSIKNISLVFRDGYGDVIKQEDYGESSTDLPTGHIEQLSVLTGRGTWNIKSVASVEVIYNLQSGGSFAAPCYLKFENITIANVSTTVNNPPEARNVSITNTAGAVMGDTLNGSYDYYDREGDAEGTATFMWYRSDDQSGRNKAPIAGATLETYTVQQADLGKWLSFEVTPAAQSGETPGYPAESGRGFITPPAITVSFDAQGGSATPSQVKRYGWTYGTNGVSGSAEQLPKPSYTGFVFEGWFVHESGTSYPVTNSTIVSSVSDITLYAYWTYEIYTVSYNGNGADGGSLPTDSSQYIYHEPAMVGYMSASPVTRKGYTFTGWNTRADGSGTALKAGDIFFVVGNTTLYAQWSINSYTVTLDAQGGTVSPDKFVKQYYAFWGDVPYLPYYPGPQRKGYSFTGWYTEPNSGGERITNMDVMKFPYDVTLYAGWEVKRPCIYLYPQNGQSQPYTYYKRWGSTYGKAADGVTSQPLPTPKAQKGYKFLGWYESWDGPQITDNTKVTVEDTQELLAYWKGKNYTVTYDPEGGSVDTESQTKVYGDTYGGVLEDEENEALPVPVKDGHTFGGWYLGDDGTGDKVTDKTVISTADHHTLHAKWTPLFQIKPLSDQVFKALAYGYEAGAQETKTITLVRTGGGDIKNISVSLSGADAGRFEVTQPLKSTLDGAASQTTFTVRAAGGMPIGGFSAVVTVSADNMEDVTFTVSQSIAPPDTAAKQVKIVVYDGSEAVPGAKVIINGDERATDESGAAMFDLAVGKYGYEIKKDGYSSHGEFSVNENAGAVCLLLQTQGQTVLADEQSGEGLILIADSGALPDGAALNVSVLTPAKSDTAAVQLLDANNNVVALFDICLLSGNEQIQPGRAVTIGIPIPYGFEGQTLKIARINEDGTAVMYDATVVGNMLFFTAEHFSRYAVVAVSQAVGAKEALATPGNVFMTILWALLGVAALAGLVLLARLAVNKRKS